MPAFSHIKETIQFKTGRHPTTLCELRRTGEVVPYSKSVNDFYPLPSPLPQQVGGEGIRGSLIANLIALDASLRWHDMNRFSVMPAEAGIQTYKKNL